MKGFWWHLHVGSSFVNRNLDLFFSCSAVGISFGQRQNKIKEEIDAVVNEKEIVTPIEISS